MWIVQNLIPIALLFTVIRNHGMRLVCLTRFDTTYLSGAWWHQNYWDRDGSDTGATLSLSTSAFDSVSVFLNGSYNRYANTDKADYSASVSVSIPF